ncbi:MAG: hypothetical protein LBG97_05050 [Coriobacteriales bacterium]|jgi:hypothetical protein|nr:hypothetical protein [Coriobacteriales bacterium]
MTSTKAHEVSIYWNNICILNKKEKTLLAELACELASDNIFLTDSQFGLGYPEHLSEHLRNKNNALPDIIVSADLEVYEDSRVFNRFAHELYPVANWVLRDNDKRLNVLYRDERLLPYVAIPLALYTQSPEIYSGVSIKDIVEKNLPLHFGGINNSAGKSVTKLIWDCFGRDVTLDFLKRSTVGEIPVVAFNAAKRDAKSAALVPTAFALTADNKKSFAFCPTDGTPVVPSYIAVRQTIPEDVARLVVQGLMSDRFLQMFVNAGRLICWRENSPKDAWVDANCKALQVPSAEFFANVSAEEFYELYCSAVPGAKTPVAM